jgi:hypothetical protein
MRARPRAKNLKDQTGAVDDLGFPLALEIALLHRRQRAVDDDEPDFLLGDLFAERFDPALADERPRYGPVEANDLAGNDVEIDRPSEANSLVEPGIERAYGAILWFAAERSLQRWVNNESATCGRGSVMLGNCQS